MFNLILLLLLDDPDLRRANGPPLHREARLHDLAHGPRLLFVVGILKQCFMQARVEGITDRAKLFHALRAEGVGADIPDTLKLPEMDPEPELQTECADAACLTVDVA